MEGKTLMKKCFVYCIIALAASILAGCGDATPEEAMNRAIVHAGKGEWEKAAKIADKTAAKYPGLAAAHVLRAAVYERCGKRDAALDSARRAVETDPESFEAQYTLGRLYAEDTARSSEAEQALLKAWKMRRDDTGVKILLCNVAMGANFPRASGYLGMLSGVPEMANRAVLYNQLAVTYVRRGDYKTASSYFSKAFRAGKKDPEILINIARFYDGCMRKRSLAVKLYREYLKVAGDDAAGRVEAAARISRLGGN